MFGQSKTVAEMWDLVKEGESPYHLKSAPVKIRAHCCELIWYQNNLLLIQFYMRKRISSQLLISRIWFKMFLRNVIQMWLLTDSHSYCPILCNKNKKKIKSVKNANNAPPSPFLLSMH